MAVVFRAFVGRHRRIGDVADSFSGPQKARGAVCVVPGQCDEREGFQLVRDGSTVAEMLPAMNGLPVERLSLVVRAGLAERVGEIAAHCAHEALVAHFLIGANRLAKPMPGLLDTS